MCKDKVLKIFKTQAGEFTGMLSINSLNHEVANYLNAEFKDKAFQSLAFWKANCKNFPTLAHMAQTYLAVLAPRTPCEQAFSIGQHIQDYFQN
ncbi:hypothetical protein VP01_646g3 [Puccinia sorghi]|uniref:HAT C-terminal dimerisation domain-containing protein n=1 Tax=Puccinia sorghi TaxID=27349 RepID=A0A0L6UFQ0_9BASI|nr:hypothetical protein VP01_646g3 [Puccinia sorghi]